MSTMDEIFAKMVADARAQMAAEDADPVLQARLAAKRKAEIESEIRRGLRDENGEWTGMPDDDAPDDEDDEPDDDAPEDDE